MDTIRNRPDSLAFLSINFFIKYTKIGQNSEQNKNTFVIYSFQFTFRLVKLHFNPSKISLLNCVKYHISQFVTLAESC